ncbi:BrnT family toxin [Rhizobium brockwellii]|uniref:BrnT family toxin n=1 Tax=Rhizobium brockwellii TaxID=3019932 RepID=A0ABU3YWW4_9HYPH|nr:BrnT family toxin [Rhizobium brockwellii]MDV4183293.1 BrnT family toxin [Rhizobium brockwellii]MDV4190304.1 BrnT family toxin [Rhizobium brockwellii]
MKLVWDEPKRIANIEKHGLDFADLTFEFFPSSVVVPAKDGRFKAIGRLADGTMVVIFVNLGSEALSIISMRPARKDERSMI